MTATPGRTFARFRLNANGDVSYDGFGFEGEVEDYEVTIVSPPPRVIDVIAASSQWSAAFIDVVDGGGVGAGKSRFG